jgi:hypothetical protein
MEIGQKADSTMFQEYAQSSKRARHYISSVSALHLTARAAATSLQHFSTMRNFYGVPKAISLDT